ncbi:hypothetical protein LCGC14_0775400 [marine sediment metagenome]|uniref:Uncharacterized protein n=1 Tax=marine sediment metagenome TaxID=412755 RepID=A0A0F9PX75_9ZZZZ
MSIPTLLKDPHAILDYGFDWNLWLATGETIVTSAWTIPDGITKDSDTNTTTTTTAWLSGGTAREEYLLVNRITTSAGRTEDRSVHIKVENR